MFQVIREANDLEMIMAQNAPDRHQELQLAALDGEAEELLGELPGVDKLGNLPLSCDDNIFLETLIGLLRSSIISFQCWVKKIKNALVNRLEKELAFLK